MSDSTVKSTGAYSPDKAACHVDRVEMLRKGEQPYPVHLHLIISDLCDLDCPGCAYRMSGYSSNAMFGEIRDGKYTHNPHRQLDPSLVHRILSDAKSMGMKAIEFTGGGEPTIHPNCAEFILKAQSLNMQTALVTNGLHLGRGAKGQELLQAVLGCQWVRLSIDAASPAVYGAVRPSLGAPRGENLYEALAALTRLRAARDGAKAPLTIGAGFVVQKENWKEIKKACELYRDAGADNVRISGIFTPQRDRYFDGWRAWAEDLERKAVDQLSTPSFKVYGRFHEKVADLAGPPETEKCWFEELTTYIGGDGNLYRCCVTAYNPHGLIGSVSENGFKALWDSEIKRQKFSTFRAPSCDFCQFRDRLISIDSLVKSREPITPPQGVIHPDFV